MNKCQCKEIRSGFQHVVLTGSKECCEERQDEEDNEDSDPGKEISDKKSKENINPNVKKPRKRKQLNQLAKQVHHNNLKLM